MNRRATLLVLAALALPPAPARAANCTGTSTGLVPLIDLGPAFYQGQQGGLYPGGGNHRPDAHNAAGVAIANAIQPLDTLGNPDPVNGRVVLISIGMSNCTQEFSALIPKAAADPVRRPSVRLIDCAVGGQTASILANPAAAYWDSVFTRLRGHGSSPLQPQAVWLKEANANPTGGFDPTRDSLTAQLYRIAQILKAKLPSVKLCYYTSRIYAGYASSTLNPEPYAYQSGFAVKNLIAAQIAGDPGLAYSGASPVAPWLAWGPYLWADGTSPRSDGLTWACTDFQASDGTHPSSSGRDKVADSLLAFLRVDQTTAPWYARGTLGVPVPPSGARVALAVAPNPAHGSADVHVRLPGAWALRVVDAEGRQVRELTGAGDADFRWRFDDRDGGAVAPGVYWLRLTGPGTTRVRTLIVR